MSRVGIQAIVTAGLVTMVLSAFPATAHAQTRNATQSSAAYEEARRGLADFSECIVHIRQEEATAVLRMERGSPAENRAARRLVATVEGCFFDRRMSMGSNLFIATLAEHIIARNPDPLANRLSLAAIRQQAGDIGTMPFGECVVRAAPHLAAALLESAVGRDAEAEALSAIHPIMGICSGQGELGEISAAAVRATVALSAFDLLDRTDMIDRAELERWIEDENAQFAEAAE